MNAEAARHATDTAVLVNEVKELRVKQTTMANEVAREVSQRVIEESSASGTPVRLAAPTSAPVPVTMTHSTRSNAGIDPGHHALLVGQSHRNRAEIDRLTRLYDERGEQLESLRGELKSECDARAEAETRARAAEATTVRLMSLNKNLLDSYQKLLDDKANAAVAAKPPGLKTTEKFSGSFSGSAAPRDHHLSHLPRVARLAHGHGASGAGRDQRVDHGGIRTLVQFAAEERLHRSEEDVELERARGDAAAAAAAAFPAVPDADERTRISPDALGVPPGGHPPGITR